MKRAITLFGLFLVFVFCIVGLTSNVQANALTLAWQERIEFDTVAFPAATTELVVGAGTTTLTYDVVQPTGTSTGGNTVYALGQDGIADLQLDVTVVDGSGGTWTQIDADYDTTSSGSFRSDFTVPGPNTSNPNDYGYVKYDFTFINGVEACITSELFGTRHTSTNGSSEAYEWTHITLNGGAIPEANIGNYTNEDYSDITASPTPGTGPGNPYPNGVTMSEFLTGSPAGTYAPGGLIMPGWWVIDDFNTTITDGIEEASANPLAGNGGPGDNQTIGGSPGYGSADGDFGYADGTNITQVTYWFGLVDVAFDTDGDGATHTNTLPSAGVTYFDVGCLDEKPLAVDMSGTDANSTSLAPLFSIMITVLLSATLIITTKRRQA